jgi:hypothetical protein
MHDHFRQALIDCDVTLVRKMWAHLSPELPQPQTDDEVVTCIHMARTRTQTIAFDLRAYSHRWLAERSLPSGLPDYLKPKAERLYPRIVEAVGIAVRTPPHRRELGLAIRQAMSNAAEECYAEKRTAPDFVRARMAEARLKILRGD